MTIFKKHIRSIAQFFVLIQALIFAIKIRIFYEPVAYLLIRYPDLLITKIALLSAIFLTKSKHGFAMTAANGFIHLRKINGETGSPISSAGLTKQTRISALFQESALFLGAGRVCTASWRCGNGVAVLGYFPLLGLSGGHTIQFSIISIGNSATCDLRKIHVATWAL